MPNTAAYGLEKEVLDFLRGTFAFGSPFVFGSHGQSLKFVQIGDEIELSGRVPNLLLLLDHNLICL